MTIEAALRWATIPTGTSRSWHAQRLGVVRGFARHLQAIDGCCEVPPPELLAFPKGRAQPYLYSQAEIASLMDAARALVPELRAATYEAVIGLLATTGMRGGEAIRLDRSDVDLGGGMVTVVSSKFGRTRLLPLHPSTAGALDAYASRGTGSAPGRETARASSSPPRAPGSSTEASERPSPGSCATPASAARPLLAGAGRARMTSDTASRSRRSSDGTDPVPMSRHSCHRCRPISAT